MMKIAIFSGTFDPITLGHIDIAERACQLFDKVIIAVADSQKKSPLFNLDERVALCQQSLKHCKNIETKPFTGLIVDAAREHQANFIVRGIRNTIDYEYEQQMAHMNRHLYPQIDTVFLATSPRVAYISSTLVREIARMQGDISELVSESVLHAIEKKLAQ